MPGGIEDIGKQSALPLDYTAVDDYLKSGASLITSKDRNFDEMQVYEYEDIQKQPALPLDYTAVDEWQPYVPLSFSSQPETIPRGMVRMGGRNGEIITLDELRRRVKPPKIGAEKWTSEFEDILSGLTWED